VRPQTYWYDVHKSRFALKTVPLIPGQLVGVGPAVVEAVVEELVVTGTTVEFELRELCGHDPVQLRVQLLVGVEDMLVDVMLSWLVMVALRVTVVIPPGTVNVSVAVTRPTTRLVTVC